MNWNLEGLKVDAKYMNEFPVSGKVDLSRVKYGGGVARHLVLDTAIEVYGQIRDRVIVNHEEVQRVYS